MTRPLARPESLNRYAYVVDSPATAADPSGNFIVSEDCFLDALLPECQCDPENGCPPDLLLLLPGETAFLASANAPTGPCGAYAIPDWRPGAVDCDGKQVYSTSVTLGFSEPVTDVQATLHASRNVNILPVATPSGDTVKFTVAAMVGSTIYTAAAMWWGITYMCNGRTAHVYTRPFVMHCQHVSQT
ncbi:MAG TPA: hypothetical protein VGS20_07280 [Candidatus Acidoferrales bacterium]|nr:hypothetical protein [Candidatus Acidoferrales bacterium]